MFTRKQILDAANQYYPDSHLANYYNQSGQPKESGGDKLADFIVSEISEVCDVQGNIVARFNDIRDRLEDAIDEIYLVLDGLKDLHNQIPGHEECWGDEDEDDEDEVMLDLEEDDHE